MHKENWQWLLLALIVFSSIGLGILLANQGTQLAQMSRALAILASQVQDVSKKQTVNPQPSPIVPTPNPIPQVITAATNQISTQPSTNIFDSERNKVGDIVAGLKVVSIKSLTGSELPIGRENVVARFAGQIQVSGAYEFSLNELSGDDWVCIALTDPREKLKLPVLVGVADQNDRFCFNNLKKAKVAFGPKYGQGQATVTIDNYELWYAPAEVNNKAELISVLSKKPALKTQSP